MSKTAHFKAECISCTDENDVLTIGVADDKYEPKKFFIIGRFDEDDLSVDECIGFQTESTEYELPASIESVTLSDEHFTVCIKDEMTDKAGAKIFKAILSTDLDREELEEFLEWMFEDSKVVIKVSS